MSGMLLASTSFLYDDQDLEEYSQSTPLKCASRCPAEHFIWAIDCMRPMHAVDSCESPPALDEAGGCSSVIDFGKTDASCDHRACSKIDLSLSAKTNAAGAGGVGHVMDDV